MVRKGKSLLFGHIFLEILKVSNAKLRKFFGEKNKLVLNDSEMSNSARNSKKNWRQMVIFGGDCGILKKIYVKYVQKVNFYLFLQLV